MMRRAALSLAAALCLAQFQGGASALADQPAPGGQSGSSGPADRLILPGALWSADGSVLAGDLSARVAMRMVKYSRVLSERALSLPEAARAWKSGDPVRPLRLSDGASGVSLSGVNEARLDYLTADPARPGMLGIVVERGQGGNREVFVSDPLETVDRLTPEWADGKGRDAVPVAGSDWVSKGVRYQVSRLLDREPDDLWRYSESGPSTFLQRRFRKNLLEVGAVDVVLLRGQDVQVNLVVSLDPQGKGKTVLDWYAIPKATFELGDGRSILRLYVGRHLREIAPGAKAAWLKEMALMFFRQDKEEVIRDRNVEKILFVPSGLPREFTKDGLPGDLPARAREVFAGRGELAVNLEGLPAGFREPGKPVSLAVVQSPQDPDLPFDQSIESARLADVAPRRDVPAILAATAERLKSFGAPCDPESPGGFVSQDPVWSLDFTPLASSASQSGELVSPAFTGKLLAVDGQGKGAVTFIRQPDGLMAECQGKGLTLSTGASFTPVKGRRYSLWLELGRSRQGLAGIEADAVGEGRTVTVQVKPGFPAEFPELPARVDDIRIRFTPNAPDMAVTLRTAVVQSFDPAAAGTGLFTARYLFDQSVQLAPAGSGKAAVSLSGKGQAMDAQWLVFKASTTAWTVNDQPPSLAVTCGGQTLETPLPAHESVMAVYLPAFGLKSGDRFDFAVTLKNGSPGAGLVLSDASVSGQRLATWTQVLSGQDLLTFGGRNRTLADLDAASAQAMAGSAVWLPMGKTEIAKGEVSVAMPANPWLQVEGLLVNHASGPRLESLARHSEEQGGGARKGPGTAGRLLALAAVIATLAAGWRFGGGALARTLPGLASRWLAVPWADQAARPAFKPWFWTAIVLMSAYVALGPDSGRALAVAATLAAVPLWRAFAPWVIRRSPGLAKNPAVHYCTGFLAFFSMAGALALAGTNPVSELLGLSGLWLFLAALVSSLESRPHHTSDPSGA